MSTEARRLADLAYESGVACGDCHAANASGHYVCEQHAEPIAAALAPPTMQEPPR